MNSGLFPRVGLTLVKNKRRIRHKCIRRKQEQAAVARDGCTTAGVISMGNCQAIKPGVFFFFFLFITQFMYLYKPIVRTNVYQVTRKITHPPG